MTDLFNLLTDVEIAMLLAQDATFALPPYGKDVAARMKRARKLLSELRREGKMRISEQRQPSAAAAGAVGKDAA